MELFDRRGTVDQLREMVAEFEQQPEIGSILIFACDANGFTPQTIDTILKETGLIVFGGLPVSRYAIPNCNLASM